MRHLSRRTLVSMMVVMERLHKTAAPRQPRSWENDSGATAAKFWCRLLYESEFPDSFITHAEKRYHFNWDQILRDLREGKFFFVSADGQGATIFGGGKYFTLNDAKNLGESMIQRLAALLCTRPGGETLHRALELDGYGVNADKLELEPLEGIVSQHEEEDKFTQLIQSVGLPNEAITLKHLGHATTLYRFGNDLPSLNESRNFLQALIDGISTETDSLGDHPTALPVSTESRLQYLREIGFFTADEEAAFTSTLRALALGSHPGVPKREQARIGLVLAIEFGQLLMLKFKSWKANQCRQFSHH
jgi:hypothetical protein